MKGQVFTLDLFVALSIFFTVIVMIAYFWLIMPNTRQSYIQEKANIVAEFLASNKLGDENILNCSKIINLSLESDPKIIKNGLNVNPYDIFVEFKNMTAVCSGNKINIGSSISSNSIASVVKIVYLDGQKMQMIVRLYD